VKLVTQPNNFDPWGKRGYLIALKFRKKNDINFNSSNLTDVKILTRRKRKREKTLFSWQNQRSARSD